MKKNNKFKVSEEKESKSCKILKKIFSWTDWIWWILIGFFILAGKRYIILERDNWECQDCGLTNEQHILCFNKCLVVHNIDGENKKIKEINNQEENLISLCMRCHGKRHKINLEKYANVKRRKSRRCK